MTGALRPYSAIDELQHRAMDDLFAHDERLALLETGFGKTVVMMTVGEELRAEGVIKRPLVFAPLRVAQITWPNERHEWVHLKDVEMVEWGGEPANWVPSLWRDSRILWGQRQHIETRMTKIEDVVKRREAKDKLGAIIKEERRVNKTIRQTEPPECWHVTSFENIGWLTDLYTPGDSPFDLWIVDETGRVARNPKSPRYKALKKHMPHAKIRYGLNATPAPEGMEDLFGQVQLVAGKKLWGASFYQWRQKYFTPKDFHGYKWRPQLGAFDLLMADLNTVAFRVPAEALKYQKTFTPREIKCTMPEKARAAYAEMEKKLSVELAEGADVTAMSEASAAGKLRQITQGYLYEVDDAGHRTVHILHEEKINAVAELIDSLNGEPLLVGYAFDQDLDNLRKIWKNIPYLGQGLSAAKAAENIVRWNKRELPVMALHPNCLHPDTLVLTEHRGWVKITDVETRDRVFDGVEFVSHKGCHLSGARPVIERFGVTMTPDHRVLINNQWVQAKDVRNTRDAARQARYQYKGNDTRLRALLSLRAGANTAQTERRSEQPATAKTLQRVPVCGVPPHDRHAPVAHMERDARTRSFPFITQLQTLRRSRGVCRRGLEGLQELLAGHAARLYRRANNRADRRERRLLQGELSLGYEHGAASQQAQQPASVLPRPADALMRVLSGGRRDARRHHSVFEKARNGRSSNAGIQPVYVPAATPKPQKVYDLVDCGPRSRFAVRNAEGEVFIVHNSASHGLNLQYGGHHICWLALPWSLDGYKQTNERIDRRGQEHACYGHHIICEDSKDQQVSEALIDKNANQNKIIDAIRGV